MDTGYNFRTFRVRPDMLAVLNKWINDGQLPGDFLQAVLSNNLKDAIGLADDDNQRNLPALIAYLYNEAPAACWGSPERVATWPGIVLGKGEPK